MNILIDMRPFYSPEMQKGNMYSENLLRALFRNHPNDVFYLWTAGEKRPKLAMDFEKYSHVKWVHTKISHSKLNFWIQSFSYPYIDDIVETQAMKEGKMAWISQVDAAIFLAPTIAPIERNCLKVYVCESLAPLHYSQVYTSETQKIHSKKNYERMLETADLVVTPSEFLKEDICATFPKKAEEEKITALGAGVLEEFSEVEKNIAEENILEKELFLEKEEEEKEDITEKLPEEFFFVRGVEPHFRNFAPLVQAYKLFQSRFGDTSWKIVIEETEKNDLEEWMDHHEDIHIFPPLNPEERASVLQKTQCFLYPSPYDGDGVAIVEAMRQNAPVLSSSFAALPEIYLETAISFDPTSYVSVLRAMKKIFRDEKKRDEIIEPANERSFHSRFRWDDISQHFMHRIAERIEEKEEEDDE
jgi:glycosyltransferase involved in cell wall biosynthesis